MTPSIPPIDPVADCLERTRSAVLNVLIGVGMGIAVSGWLLRWRDRWAVFRAPSLVGQAMLGGLLLVAVASYVVRRAASVQVGDRPSGAWTDRFYRGHVLAAAVGSLAVPLGLAYGWLVRPQLRAVVPFWVVALALGFLALPRAYELDTQGVSPRANDPLP